MHQELSKRDKVPVIWLALWIVIAAIVLITLNVLLVKLHVNTDLTDFIIIGICAVATYFLIKQNLISYKYCIIDDEVIVHEVMGSKEKIILNLNVNQIVKFNKVSDPSYEEDKQGTYSIKQKLYNCVNKDNRHYVVFEEDDALRWFTFQPSEHMAALISERIQH